MTDDSPPEAERADAPAPPPDPMPLDASTAEELLELTRRMTAAATADDWASVACHDRARHELLERAPSEPREPVPEALATALAAADRELLEQARQVRDARGEEAHRTRAERAACGSYASVMRGGATLGESHAR